MRARELIGHAAIYSRPMLAAAVWHHWLSFFILVPAILVVIGVVVGYLTKVVAPRYGRR